MHKEEKIALIFPGQGAQFPGMGKDVYTHFPQAKQIYETADHYLKRDFSQLIFESSAEVLKETCNSQLAIYITCSALWAVFRELFPDLSIYACAGLSLGEYVALYVAGKITFQEGLELVHIRAKGMQEACEKNVGSMRVVLGLSPEEIAHILPSDVWIANLNCPGQVVIAGLKEALEKSVTILQEKGAKKVIPLEVSGAFHTPLMDIALQKLAPRIDALHIKKSPCLLAMNVPGDFVEDPELIKEFLKRQVVSPTQWEKSIRRMVAEGIERFIEIGPGTTLTGMNRKIGISSSCLHSIQGKEDMESLQQLQIERA